MFNNCRFRSQWGAGIQADIRTFTVLRKYSASVITALTAQNSASVRDILYVDKEFFRQQLGAVLSGTEFQAIKLGMIGRGDLIDEICLGLDSIEVENLVIDPVMKATSGVRLSELGYAKLLKEKLIPRATIITPNAAEAAILLGGQKSIGEAEIWRDTEAALVGLHKLGCRSVVLTSGDREASGNRADSSCEDYFYDGSQINVLTGERLENVNSHGSGCTFSAAIAAYLAESGSDKLEILSAVKRAKTFTQKALAASKELSVDRKLNEDGGREHGPINQLGAS